MPLLALESSLERRIEVVMVFGDVRGRINVAPDQRSDRASEAQERPRWRKCLLPGKGGKK